MNFLIQVKGEIWMLLMHKMSCKKTYTIKIEKSNTELSKIVTKN